MKAQAVLLTVDRNSLLTQLISEREIQQTDSAAVA